VDSSRPNFSSLTFMNSAVIKLSPDEDFLTVEGEVFTSFLLLFELCKQKLKIKNWIFSRWHSKNTFEKLKLLSWVKPADGKNVVRKKAF
jgi:hypothetical protein